MPLKITLSQDHYLQIDQKKATGNNCNKWAHVFEKGQPLPLTGTNFLDGTPDAHLVVWALEALKSIPQQASLFSLIQSPQ